MVRVVFPDIDDDGAEKPVQTCLFAATQEVVCGEVTPDHAVTDLLDVLFLL